MTIRGRGFFTFRAEATLETRHSCHGEREPSTLAGDTEISSGFGDFDSSWRLPML